MSSRRITLFDYAWRIKEPEKSISTDEVASVDDVKSAGQEEQANQSVSDEIAPKRKKIRPYEAENRKFNKDWELE